MTSDYKAPLHTALNFSYAIHKNMY